MTRFFARTVDRHVTQSDEFDAVGFPIVSTDFFATNFDRSVQIRRLLRKIFAHGLAVRRRIRAKDLTVDGLRAGKDNALDLFGARDFQDVHGTIGTAFESQSWLLLAGLVTHR